jgi:hypothetical protein
MVEAVLEDGGQPRQATLGSTAGELKYPTYAAKKVIAFPVPNQDVTNQTLPGRDLFQTVESLVSDIPAGDGKNDDLYFAVQ